MIKRCHNNLLNNSMHWYSATTLNVPHAMLCRFGGISLPPFADLNLSYGIGDKPAAVVHNRQQLKQQFKIKHLVSGVQVHSDTVVIAENISRDTEFTDADALISRQPGVGLLIQQADCQAILLHDPTRGVIGAIHSGWRGSVLNINGKTVAQMQEHYGVQPAELRAVISPSLGPCCAEFVNHQLERPDTFQKYQITANHFDFWAISRSQLLAAGLINEHIEQTGLCNACNHDFFSYRRAVQQENGQTGRNGSVIVID